ncbi:uncharacterized protein METZ01_LOCUS433602, partial [marine metagenome]
YLEGPQMSEALVYPVPETLSKFGNIDNQTYKRLYSQSIDNPEIFWAEQARRLDWIKPWDQVKATSFDRSNISIKWFDGGKLNVSANCIDRHADKTPDRTAIIWEADDPTIDKAISYAELKVAVCQMANVLRKHGVGKGDRVTIYMPMVPEAAFAMLACTRIGAIHSVVFGGFSPDSLADRIIDCESTFLITADEGIRGGRIVPLKANVDKALERCPECKHVLVIKRTGGKINWTEGQDLWWEEEMSTVSKECNPEPMDAEDPLF